MNRIAARGRSRRPVAREGLGAYQAGDTANREGPGRTALRRRGLDAYEAGTRDGGVRRNPKVLEEDRASVRWTDVAGARLIRSGVSFDDVIQGHVGDCYFLSALSAMARVDPTFITNAVKDHGDGTYSFRFFVPREDGSRVPRWVRVTDEVPLRDGAKPRYATSRDRKELWVGLMEKAYAALKGGYESISQGGAAGEAMALVGGGEASLVHLENLQDSAVVDLLEKVTAKHVPACCSTWGDDALVPEKTRLLSRHAYTFLGIKHERGEPYVCLRNPWGDTEPGRDKRNDGIFKLSIEDFRRYFSAVTVGSKVTIPGANIRYF